MARVYTSFLSPSIRIVVLRFSGFPLPNDVNQPTMAVIGPLFNLDTTDEAPPTAPCTLAVLANVALIASA